jgi:hypothetical protein
MTLPPFAGQGQLLESEHIAGAVKLSLLTRISRFAGPVDRPALQTAADYALRLQVTLDADMLLLFAQAS